MTQKNLLEQLETKNTETHGIILLLAIHRYINLLSTFVVLGTNIAFIFMDATASHYSHITNQEVSYERSKGISPRIHSECSG